MLRDLKVELNKINISYYTNSSINYYSALITILIFEKTNGTLWIQSREYPIKAGAIYVIPPMHHYWLNEHETNGCISATINVFELDKHYQLLFYSILYREKIFENHEHDSEISSRYIAEMKDKNGDSSESFFQYMDYVVVMQHKTRIDTSNYKYLSYINHFLTHLFEDNTLFNEFTLYTYCRLINVSGRTLDRACKALFNLTAKNIARQHIVNRSYIYILANSNSIGDISNMLGFNDHTNFSRFIKDMTGLTPSQIRSKYSFLT